jgi:hypothetical protein
VEDDLPENGMTQIIRGNFISQAEIQLNSNDEVKRSLLRHDADTLAKILEKLF